MPVKTHPITTKNEVAARQGKDTTRLRKAAYRGQKRQKTHPFNTKNATKGVRAIERKIQVVGS